MLDGLAGVPGCLWVATPDVVGDARATLGLFRTWQSRVAGRGLPVALVGQDGLRPGDVPWRDLDALFVGGCTEWKLSADARQLCREAKDRGKLVHVGRVNSRKRIREVASWGTVDAALAPALMTVAELPSELVPFVGWVLAEFLASRPRRAKAGEPVPGAHLFVFRDGRWHHGASLETRDSGRAAELLRRRVRWERDRGVAAGLLLRVADDGRLTARKLVWFAGGVERETANLSGTTATLSASDYRLVTDELELDEVAFVIDTPEKLRGLFAVG